MSRQTTNLSQNTTVHTAPALPQNTFAVSAFAAPLAQPLALDLDFTLIRSDLMLECLATALKRNPMVIFLAFFWLLQGRAMLKHKLAKFAPPAVDLIPANARVVALAHNEFNAGRHIVLATAADMISARRIAQRFAFIDEVIASDGQRNLKGAAKAQELSARFPQGFLYAGDSAADMPVWQAASEVIVVEAAPSVARRAAALGKPTLTLDAPRANARLVAKALRLKQWAKNALIFAPVLLAGLALAPAAWMQAAIAFIALGLVASATYLLNDIVDLADDRRHWSKKNRPLASGALRLGAGLRLMLELAAVGFWLAAFAGWKVAAVIAVYAAITLAYSFKLKRVPIVDVATLAALFTLRLFLGVVAIGAVISPWLFVFSMALFLSLSIAKRHTEVVRMSLHNLISMPGRGYVARDEPLLLAMGLAAAASAIVLFSLYLTAEAFRATVYSAPAFLWATPVVLFLWLGRIWLLSQRGELDDDPVAFALKDRASLAMGGLLALSFGLAGFAGRFL